MVRGDVEAHQAAQDLGEDCAESQLCAGRTACARFVLGGNGHALWPTTAQEQEQEPSVSGSVRRGERGAGRCGECAHLILPRAVRSDPLCPLLCAPHGPRLPKGATPVAQPDYQHPRRGEQVQKTAALGCLRPLPGVLISSLSEDAPGGQDAGARALHYAPVGVRCWYAAAADFTRLPKPHLGRGHVPRRGGVPESAPGHPPQLGQGIHLVAAVEPARCEGVAHA